MRGALGQLRKLNLWPAHIDTSFVIVLPQRFRHPVTTSMLFALPPCDVGATSFSHKWVFETQVAIVKKSKQRTLCGSSRCGAGSLKCQATQRMMLQAIMVIW